MLSGRKFLKKKKYLDNCSETKTGHRSSNFQGWIYFLPFYRAGTRDQGICCVIWGQGQSSSSSSSPWASTEASGRVSLDSIGITMVAALQLADCFLHFGLFGLHTHPIYARHCHQEMGTQVKWVPGVEIREAPHLIGLMGDGRASCSCSPRGSHRKSSFQSSTPRCSCLTAEY